jgi:hypothetical protein
MKSFLTILLFFLLVSCSQQQDDIKYDYYLKLDEIINQKSEEVTQYFSLIEESLRKIETDGPLIHSFSELNKIYSSYKSNQKIEISSTYQELEDIILSSYFERFMLFDNLLFINLDGDVFYSLRKKEPLLQNLFSDKYISTTLSQSLLKEPLTLAVDFDFFLSNDPAAFFVYPVILENEHLGWCAFQFSSKKLDMLFSLDKTLGSTGEVFMVNENSYMLTNSYFSPESSVLKQHLSVENISQKFLEQKGHKEVLDYRGYKTLSSFEVYSIFNLNWLLIAKIDLDEILSIEYSKDPEKYYESIRLKTLQRNKSYLTEIPEFNYQNEVKLDEFRRIYESGTFYTHGVSTCTAVLVTLPGKFSYLAHISAYDELYGGDYTDLITNLFSRIKKYEIPDYLIRQIEVYLITPKIQFSQNVLNRFLDTGILLSQIHLIKNKDADYANVYHDLDIGKTYIEWHLSDDKNKVEDTDSITSVGDIIDNLILY